MIRISLTAKNFSKRISNILEIVKRLDSLLDNLSYAVDIQTYSSYIRWEKGGRG